jgi:type IV pilus assembly protein PilA
VNGFKVFAAKRQAFWHADCLKNHTKPDFGGVMSARHEKGFTLIELMIVVAIIGILASIAIPAYQDYIARAQTSEAVQLMAGAKTPLSEYYADHGQWPAAPASIDLQTGGRYVIATAIFTQGAGTTGLTLELTSTFRTDSISKFIAGSQIALTTVDGGKSWVCAATNGSAGIKPKYLPSACR